MQKAKKGIVVCLLIGIISIHGFGQTDSSGGATLTLKQCVETALTNNIPVKQSGLLVESAKADWQKSKANLLPNVNASWGYGLNQGRAIDPFTNGYINQQFSSSSVGLNAGVTLFAGLQLQNLIRQTGYAYHASELEWQQSKDKLTLDVILAYLTVLNNEDTWRIMSEQAEVTRKQVERLTILFEKGAVGSYLLSDMKGQLSGDELSAITNYNALQTAKLNLAQLMNIPYDKDMKLQRLSEADLLEMYPASAQQVYDASLQNLAMVKALDLRVQSANKGVSVAKGAFYPTLSLNGSLGSNYSSISNALTPTTVTEVATGEYVTIDNNKTLVYTSQQNYDSKKIAYNSQIKNNLGKYIGLSLSVPIFNNLQVTTQVKKAKLNAKNAAYDAENNKLVLKQSIEKAHQDMVSAYEKYKVLQEQVVQYKESFRSAEIRFNLGTIVSTEYLLTKNNYDRAQLNLTQTWYEYIFRTRILDFYQGKLTL
ncbi:MAG: TolC family protein [Agriterribacter sp.]